jgi:surface polysaccharide O-acyltransferase-like enzyme
MVWLDGARLAAAFCIIALHSSSDSNGQAFADALPGERVFPVMLRTVSEIASTEYFILVSLFLLVVRMSRRELSYLDNIKQQARRLLVPFVVWTVFYAFFRLYKAHHFGYAENLWAEISQWQSWVFYLTLGWSNYHMHFLPTLFVLILCYPVYRLAIVAPVIGLVIVPLIYLNGVFGEFIWLTFDNIMVIESWMRVAKLLTYTGYGFVAYALYGIWLRGLDKTTTRSLLGFALLALLIGFMIKLVHAAHVINTGHFGTRTGAAYMGHFIYPCFVVLAFMSAHHFRWPAKLSQWSKYAFGMYLLHPAFLYLLEVAIQGYDLTPATTVLARFGFAATMSLCMSVAISRVPWLAWTIGLGPIPWVERTLPDKKSNMPGTTATT